MSKKLFKSGLYFIGDPCYLFDKSWDNVLDQTGYFDKDIKDQRINGLEVAAGSTAYGDGEYTDNDGHTYSVDAGLIGILPIELTKLDNKYDLAYLKSFGRIVNFGKDFEVDIEGGTFLFGDIFIDTNFEENEEEDND